MLGKRVAEAMSGLINAHLVQLSCPGFESKKRKNIFLLKCVDWFYSKRTKGSENKRQKNLLENVFQTRFKNRFWNLFPGEALVATWHSTTPPVKALSHDRLYYFLPYWDEKPTIYIRSTFPDHRKRMYNSNSIGRIADKVVSSELFWIQIWAVQWSLSLRILVFKTGAQWAILYQVNAIMTMLMS